VAGTGAAIVIYIGIDDTDIGGSPETEQLACAILKRLGRLGAGGMVCRHQLFFDPRVPYTSRNGAASLRLPQGDRVGRVDLIETVRKVMKAKSAKGSDPGLCVASVCPTEMAAFGARAKTALVTPREAREVAERAGCHLEGLGGSGQGVIGALAAISLVAGGEDGRIVRLHGWPAPDEFAGPQPVGAIASRGVVDILELESGSPFRGETVDVGPSLRPNWRRGRVVLYVEPPADPGGTWHAVNLL
jgi:hypothetical protein